MSTRYDVVVVGNGSIGLTIAWEILQQSASARVAVIGPSTRPGSASLAAGAMLNAWAELEAGAMDDPALAARAGLAVRALSLWDRHAQALTEASGMRVQPTWGTYVLSGSSGPATEERAYAYMLERVAALGGAASVSSASDLPFLAAQPSRRAMRVAQVPDGAVDSHAVVAALDAILQRNPRCRCIDAHAENLSVAPQGDKLVHLDDGTAVRAASVVLANGAYARQIVDRIPALRASVPPIFFGTGFGLDVSFPATVQLPPDLAALCQVVRTMDRGGGCGMHLIPAASGSRRFYFGASSAVSVSPESQPRVHALAVLLDGLSAEFHEAFFHAQVAVRPAGYRPVTLDAFPLLGASAVEGVWFCNGTKRDGFTCAPLLAREIARGVLGGRCDLPALFQPCRPLISYRSKAQAIELAAAAAVGSDEMRGLRLPSYRREEWLANQRARIVAIYERRGIERFGIHPELLHFYESDALYAATAQQRSWA